MTPHTETRIDDDIFSLAAERAVIEGARVNTENEYA